MVSDLIVSKTRGVVVIDNCAPALHRRITELCVGEESLLSVITIEYDVRDDEPEATDVYRLEPSSQSVLTALLSRRYTNMSEPDVARIAEFSGGNARIALATAKSISRGESAAGLGDEELFGRLFHQRQSPDDSLMRAAQACALVYSFQGEALTGDEAELPVIATLASMNAQQLFEKISNLRERELIQRRGVWQAVLPQAIANRLARKALRNWPLETIEATFNTDRLLRSFSRRVGYLHESAEAQKLVERWLSEGGRLDAVGQFTPLGLAVFENIAAVSPEATIAAIERAASRSDLATAIGSERQREVVGHVLQAIAYDASLFARCVELLVSLTLAEPPSKTSHPLLDLTTSLFYPRMSGTHATAAQRINVVAGLLRSPLPERRSLGAKLLAPILSSDSSLLFPVQDFGARPRDYGYAPTTVKERADWFVGALEMARAFAVRHENAASIRSIVADSLWNAWFLSEDVQTQFEHFAAEVNANGYWEDGWLAVRYKLAHLSSAERQLESGLGRLRKFERNLRPGKIKDRVRAIVLTSSRRPIDFIDPEVDLDDPVSLDTAATHANKLARELGRTVASDAVLFAELMPELVRGDGIRLYNFGYGIALGCSDHERAWEHFTAAAAAVPHQERNLSTLCGYIAALANLDPPLCEAILEAAMSHPDLGRDFPRLQSSTLTSAGIQRLVRAAEGGESEPASFDFLSWPGMGTVVGASAWRRIVEILAKQENGYTTALKILASNLRESTADNEAPQPDLVAFGREVLSSISSKAVSQSATSTLAYIADICLRGKEAAHATLELCERIIQTGDLRTPNTYQFEKLLQAIFELQPIVALEAFLRPELDTGDSNTSGFDYRRFTRMRNNPLSYIKTADLQSWCEHDPSSRYPIASQVVPYYTEQPNGDVEWTDAAITLIRDASSPEAVLQGFINRFRPNAWSGSLASTLESRLRLLTSLYSLELPELDNLIASTIPALQLAIQSERDRENALDRERDERFE